MQLWRTTIVVFVLCFCFLNGKGYQISLSSCPQILDVHKTGTLALHCAVWETPSSTHRDLDKHDLDTRDIDLHTLQHVESIVVTRNTSTPVAMVTVYDPARALGDRGTLNVTGSLDVNNTLHGYLSLTWQNASFDQVVGSYMCDVTGLDAMGQPVTLNRNLTLVTTQWLERVENLASAYLGHPVNNLTHKNDASVDFHSCPDVLSTNTSAPNTTLTMRCGLHDLQATSGQSQTPPLLQHIESIVISRGQGQTVADLTFFNDPEVKVDLDKLRVKGTLNGGGGEKGYIELTWQQPTAAQSGTYRCDVTGMDGSGQQVTLTSWLEVYTDQKLANLRNMATIYQKEQKDKEIRQLTSLMASLESDLHHLQSQLDKLTSDMTSQLVTSSPPAVPSTSAVIVQQGRLECTDSSNWHRDSVYGVYTTISHKFSTPYPSTPHVHIAVDSVDVEQGTNVRYDVKVISVDKNGFTVKCKTWGVDRTDSGTTHLWHLRVDYFSVL